MFYSENSRCLPTSPRSFFYAYSTDLDPASFGDVFGGMLDSSMHFIPYAFYVRTRLDLQQPEKIEYFSDINSWNNSIHSHWPDPSLGFLNSSAGSDVFEIIESFLYNSQVPICGCVIHITLKRYPNEEYLENMILRIRQYHAIVNVVIPTNPSGGLYSEIMYSLATKTNGLGFFVTDDGYLNGEVYINNEGIIYPIYAVNVNVSETGSIRLPNMFVPQSMWYWIVATVQDSGILSTFEKMSLTFSSPGQTRVWKYENRNVDSDGNYNTDVTSFSDGNYKVTLNYTYSDLTPKSLQIRIGSINSCKNSVISHWPDPSLGFSNRSAGSDVLRVIETFLDNDHVALCGAYIEILLKRYPNEKEIDQLVARLRQIHASVTVVIPTNSSGGLYPETMYRLATKTNGLGFFTLDDEYQHTNSILTYFGDYPWLVYSENVIVSQSGSMNLPRMSIPATNIYFFGTTTEDSGKSVDNVTNRLSELSGVVSFASTTFQINNMILTKPGVSFKLFETYDEVWDTNILWTSKTIESGNYDVTFYYNYSDSREQTLQIRVYSMIPTNYWIPYAD